MDCRKNVMLWAAWAVAALLMGCTGDATELGSGEDGGSGSLVPDQDPCAALVQRTCAGSCDTSPPCAASRLAQQHEPQRCPDMLADEASYPACVRAIPQACEDLEFKVCGGNDGGACSALDTCLAAREVADGLDPAQCRQGLGDETSFPRCNL